MTVRVGVNGFGQIGRTRLRAALDRAEAGTQDVEAVPPARAWGAPLDAVPARTGPPAFGGCLDGDADGWPARRILRAGQGGTSGTSRPWRRGRPGSPGS
ncbi:hypothetical protein [Streptomyces sp. NPDC056660]|uniref:hypothetical protein n=1 Tax=Streptomyces sp. NPDC056660 TaxID=3345897 RepID=UPI003691F51D